MSNITKNIKTIIGMEKYYTWWEIFICKNITVITILLSFLNRLRILKNTKYNV